MQQWNKNNIDNLNISSVLVFDDKGHFLYKIFVSDNLISEQMQKTQIYSKILLNVCLKRSNFRENMLSSLVENKNKYKLKKTKIMNTNELFNDEIFNSNESLDTEFADSLFTPEVVIKDFINNLIKEHNLDGFIQDRGISFLHSDNMYIMVKSYSFKIYYNEIKTIYLKNQTMVITYKQGWRDTVLNFVINKKTNKLNVRWENSWNFKSSDDYEVYEF